jgi:hypothetical protein
MGKNKRFFSDWGQDFYQSMDSRRRKYIDKVIDFLLRDTNIDYEDNHIDFPFFPMYRLFINDENLGYFYHSKRFDKYCREQYGLTKEETFYVWTKYRYSIGMNIGTKGGTEKDRFGRLDESDDRRKNFLDKVVDFLVKDTKVDYEDRELFFPFTLKKSLRQNTDNSTPFHKILFNKDSVIPRDGFMEYIDEMYGINTIEEISYVWGKYKDVMRYIVFGNDPTSEPIYESDDKKKGYLNKIIVLLVTGTVIDWKEERVTFPYLPEIAFAFFQYPFSTLGKVPTHRFSEYCIDTYGLTEDEIYYVWKFYVDAILGEYNNKSKLSDSSFMNESEDKKQNYLNKIIDWLVDDTEVGGLWFEPPYKTGLIYAENSITLTSIYKQTFGLLKYVTDEEEVKFVIQMNYFKRFCKEQYGLTEDETEYVWKGFMKDLYESEKYNSLNESEDRKQKYLDKILKWFVDDTIIRYETGIIIYPFSLIGPNGKPLPSFIYDLQTKLSWGMSSDIQITCRDTYGLNYDETKYIWNNYKKIIKDRYNKESIMYDLKPINESEDKRQVYLDKVVDWLVGDTEIGDSWFSPPYYHPGSSAGRTGFRSVYGHTFGLLRDTNYSGLDTQLIYFNSYCKNNYGLTEDETNIVWRQYMKRLYDSYDWIF